VKLFNLAEMIVRQRFEFEADQFATTLTNAADVRSALIKLHSDNLAFPMSDWLYWRWYHSHPPLIDRLNSLH